jgi:hypothetical protein
MLQEIELQRWTIQTGYIATELDAELALVQCQRKTGM